MEPFESIQTFDAPFLNIRTALVIFYFTPPVKSPLFLLSATSNNFAICQESGNGQNHKILMLLNIGFCPYPQQTP